MRKTAKIDFFLVGHPESTEFETLLRNLHSKPADSEKRNVEINDDYLRLARGELKGDSGYLGDFMRISMAPAGFRATLDGRVTPVILSKDEGVAETAAFYYDFASRILVLQRNSKAATIKQVGTFLHFLTNAEEEIPIEPILRPTDLDRVKTMDQIRKIHISAAIIDAMTSIEDTDANTKNLIANAAQSESPAIELILKSGREKDATMNQAVALETLGSWLQIQDGFADDENEIVRKILVSGKEDGGTPVEFDLLKDKMVAAMHYEWVPDHEAMWKTRSEQIQKTWDLNHKHLERFVEVAANKDE